MSDGNGQPRRRGRGSGRHKDARYLDALIAFEELAAAEGVPFRHAAIEAFELWRRHRRMIARATTRDPTTRDRTSRDREGAGTRRHDGRA